MRDECSAKKRPDARELFIVLIIKVHTVGEGNSHVQLTFCLKTGGALACERASEVKLSIDTP